MQLAPKAVRIEGGEGGTQVYPVLRRGREYCLGARGCCLLVDGLLYPAGGACPALCPPKCLLCCFTSIWSYSVHLPLSSLVEGGVRLV